MAIISKLAERKVQSRLLEHLEKNSLLSRDHHAYRHKLSTTTALISIMDKISEAADQNLIASSMSLDQTLAFDCVVHHTLMEKLKFYKLDANMLKWI